MKKILFLIMLTLSVASATMAQAKADTTIKDTVVKAQTAPASTALINDVEMADTMRSSGKIYVVIATIAIVFVGLAVFLFAIERRVKKLEDQNSA